MSTIVYAMIGTVGNSEIETSTLEDDYDGIISPDEIHDGIIEIRISTYGDDIGSIILQVNGIDKESVKETWERVSKTAYACLREWWGTGELTLGSAAFRPSQNPHSGG